MVSEANHHTTIFFSNRMRKTQILLNKPVYLGLPILESSKIVIHEFCYDYAKPKHRKKCVIWIQAVYCIHKNRLFLSRHCRRCLNKVEQTTTERKK